MLGLDTETTGLDLWHGCKPFFVSTCREDGTLAYWEWDVDPMTRTPLPPKRDLVEIRKVLHTNALVFHNAKFDVRALATVGVNLPKWDRVEDTLIASHALASGKSHKLKDLALEYLDIPDTDQAELREAVIHAQRIGRKKGWRVAKANDPHWPAMKRPPKGKDQAGDSWWACDMFIPRAVAKAEKYPKDHPWWTVCQRYALMDAERTIGLWMLFRDALKVEGLWEQYQTRKKMLGITYRMESRGVTTHSKTLVKAADQYNQNVIDTDKVCRRLANNKIGNLSSPQQLNGILFGHFKLRGIKKTETGYSTDRETLETLLDRTPQTSKAWHFINNLNLHRKYGKALDYLDGYQKSGIPLAQSLWLRDFAKAKGADDYLSLHPNFNITGTDTTRLSSNNPNAQNISKKEGFNLRQVFGPIPGREWYSKDFSNIELRIFAYESGDKDLIRAFETGYSVHLIIAEELYPKEFAACLKAGKDFKKVYESTLYQWIKNGNFSLIYGAGEEKADLTYHLKGAYRRIRKRFKAIDRFMSAKYEEAVQRGYITTIGGYRLQVPKDGPHKAVNYFVQGSAGWAMVLAMVRVDDYLRLNAKDAGLVMTIHDELVTDFPISKYNLGHVRKIKSLMESVGHDFGFPIPVEVDRIRTNWAEEEKVTFTTAA